MTDYHEVQKLRMLVRVQKHHFLSHDEYDQDLIMLIRKQMYRLMEMGLKVKVRLHDSEAMLWENEFKTSPDPIDVNLAWTVIVV